MFGQSANEVNSKHYALFDNYVGIENSGISNGVILEIEYKDVLNNEKTNLKFALDLIQTDLENLKTEIAKWTKA